MTTHPASHRVPRIVVRRSPIHGRGVFARRDLTAGEMLLEYVGERIDWEVAINRPPADPANPDHTFFFDLGDGRVIDGAAAGNSSRWINHSCAPNCEAEDRDGRIFIRALRAIDAGDEISIDYALAVDGRVTRSMRDRYACRCGASTCRGTMLAVRRRRKQAHEGGLVNTAQGVGDQPSAVPPDAVRSTVRILERPGSGRLIVSWRQAGRGCYSEQLWTAALATAGGICVVSGQAYERGDAVFQPTSSSVSLNQAERICADSVAHIPIDEAA
ncbi:SET domain-containing protein-lysine N-methyltransferase [Burkholderia sp. Bp9031]|uniref:SET domain-containing protein-lysine N-methyltransferase n=1 Tax=Burkholderia sp. Bp9031 TaxID=2184566 RepID=UPI000F5F1C4A|nr:SET domain-containing protein-lysine N-methyltransferase [Burkholderia sp. Bp9031]